MGNEKIIVHVGLQKTATTFFQKKIFPRLENYLYIGRPYTQENYAFNMLQYADDSIYSHSILQKEIRRIIDEANGKSILISDELFTGFTFYNFINRGIIAERLSKVLPDAEILLFLRGQKDLILSLYNQNVKQGRFDMDLNASFLSKPGLGFSFDMWMDGKRSWNKKNRFLDSRSVFSVELFRYSSMYSLYKRYFKKVHVVLYEELENDCGRCMKKIETILSSKIPEDQVSTDKKSKERINQSVGDVALRAKLIQNKLSHVFSGFIFKLWKLLSTGMAIMMPDKNEDNQRYVLSCLEERDIYNDNYNLNEKLKLGMERYPHKYFGDDFVRKK